MLKVLRKFQIPFTFFVVSFLLVAYWFKDGYTFGAGETGNPYYNLSLMFGISGWAWGNQMVGGSSGLTVASATFFGLLSFLQNVGIPGFLLQAAFLFLTLYLALYGMYGLTRKLFPEYKVHMWVLSALFYVVNPYSMMNIWNRFLLNTVLFYAVLPIGLWIYINGLKSKKYSQALLLGIVTSLSSYAFGAPAQTLIFWFLILFTSFFFILFFKGGWFVLKYFAFSIIVWGLSNFWWISHQFYYRFSQTYSYASEVFFSTYGNLGTLNSLSKTLGEIQNVFLLQHGPFFKTTFSLPYSWPLFYSKSVSLIAQWFVFFLILYTSVKNIRRKWILYFLTIFFISVFAAKGNSPPLGEFFTILFQKISFIQFFRNPFEKLGVLLGFGLSPLFGITVVDTSRLFSKRNKNLSTLVLLSGFAYALIFFGFPFWTRLVFTGSNPPTNDPDIGLEIKVPNYYKDADSWLKENEGIFRFISLPLGGEGIFNDWEIGYAGIEQSGVLFSTPSISYNTTIPYFTAVVDDIEELFLTEDEFYKVAAILNVRYLLLRQDVNFQLSGLRNPARIEEEMNNKLKIPSAYLSKDREFGKLKFYRFSEEVFLPKIYASSNIILTNKPTDLKNLFVGNFAIGDAVLDIKQDNNLLSNVHSVVLHPNSTLQNYSINREISTEPGIYPYVGRISTSKLYSAVLAKERLTEKLLLDPDRKSEFLIETLGKRLRETANAVALGDSKAAEKSLNLYEKLFPAVINQIKFNSIPTDTGIALWRKDFVRKVFDTHQVLFDELLAKTHEENLKHLITFHKNNLTQASQELLLAPKAPVDINDSFPLDRRWIYEFSVPYDSDYEFIFSERNWEDYYITPEKTLIQVDGVMFVKKITKTQDGYMTLGTLRLAEGVHEIGFNYPPAKKLVKAADDIHLTALNESQFTKIPLEPFDPFSSYSIFFGYNILKGLGPTLSIGQNTDTQINDRPDYRFQKHFPTDKYWFQAKQSQENFVPSRSADKMELIFQVDQWNDCEESLKYNSKLCKDLLLKNTFNRQTEVIVTSLAVSKIPSEAYLRSVQRDLRSESPSVEFQKINQTRYRVKVREASKPYVLVFSELFDRGWKANMLETGYIKEQKHFIVNGYANGWLIDNPQEQEIILEYSPQKFLAQGYIISSLSLLAGTLILVLIRKVFR